MWGGRIRSDQEGSEGTGAARRGPAFLHSCNEQIEDNEAVGRGTKRFTKHGGREGRFRVVAAGYPE